MNHTNVPENIKNLSPEEAYLQGKIEGMDLCHDIFFPEVDSLGLNEATVYLNAAGVRTDDWSNEEVIENYKALLRREMNEGDIDINLSNEQVT